ncbi:protein FAM8A1-like isoform X1 [Acipenser ruthenus]|uniref:protein FAM8A1-like isoform X1 n=1 Tax=Acipenser ruthenus TaxID=7906 RepID=UPI002740E499|nr:protein FAM8A1-like isoform X1 [Acipenser ruthenus]
MRPCSRLGNAGAEFPVCCCVVIALIMADLARGLDKISASNSMDKTNIIAPKHRTGADMIDTRTRKPDHDSDSKEDPDSHTTASEYCGKLQEWMWQYYWHMNWQNWMAMSVSPFPSYPAATQNGATQAWQIGQSVQDVRVWYNNNINQFPFAFPPYFPPVEVAGAQGQVTAGTTPVSTRPVQQQHANVQQAGREYTIPSPLHRLIAEIVDFFILFFIKASIVLSILHFSGMKEISKFAMNYIVEEIDEDTSTEELQKMMMVALVYRVLVCFYEVKIILEIICIWGAGGATPGKFLLGLRVVTCDTSVLVRPDRVLVMPASNVSMSASTVRALNKNFSIAFFFPAFITLLFFQHNRTVYDIVAGTIVVKRNGAR